MRIKRALVWVKEALFGLFKRMDGAWAEAGEIQRKIDKAKAEHQTVYAYRTGHLR